MHTMPLDSVPIWCLVLGYWLWLWACMEAGYRFGRWRHARAADERDQPVGAMVGSILGLLALVLAFTFNLAAMRFDKRREMVIVESNAIGTTYLRSRLLPVAHRDAVSALLREYAQVRLSAVDFPTLEAAIRRSEQLHVELWSHAKQAAVEQPSIITSLFIESLNELIDLHTTRLFYAIQCRVPPILWLSLMLMIMLGIVAIGYQAGLSTTRRSPAMLGLIFAIVLMMYLILDLDRSREGWIQVSQKAMLDLKRTMESHQFEDDSTNPAIGERHPPH